MRLAPSRVDNSLHFSPAARGLAGAPPPLYAELKARHGFSLPAERLRVALNDP